MADYEQALSFDPQYAPATVEGSSSASKATRPAVAPMWPAKHFQADIDREMTLAGVRER